MDRCGLIKSFKNRLALKTFQDVFKYTILKDLRKTNAQRGNNMS